MAIKRRARIVARLPVGPRSVRFDLRMIDEELRFVGGQYVIVETGIVVDEKPIKRVFSLASTDADAHAFSLVVHRHGDGLGSNAMASREVGDELIFSGPWGKCLATDDASSRTLVVATSTGITAAMGLLLSRRMASRVVRPSLVVLTSSEELVPVVHAEVLDAWAQTHAVGLTTSHCRLAPPLLDELTERIFRGGHDEAFLVGSGFVNTYLAASAIERGFSPDRIFVEHFFDKPDAKERAAS